MTDTNPALACTLGWLAPGAGHFFLGRRQKAIVFAIVVPLMFVAGLLLEGRLFPVVMDEPLVGLAALAEMGMGVAYLIASLVGWGGGEVTARTYEYGNTFLITAGLLNLLIVIDAYDIAVGRK